MNLLVLCRANVARSPLAAAMLLDAAPPDVRVGSAGVRAREGDPAAEQSRRLAAERGLDLTWHRSTPVTADHVRQADLVLAMSESIRDRTTPLAPGSSGKVFTLREFLRLTEHVDRAALASETEPGGERLTLLRDLAHRNRAVARRPSGPENVVDPMGKPWADWIRLGETLDGLLATLVQRASD